MTAAPHYRILLVEDDAVDAELIGFALERAEIDFELHHIDTPSALDLALDQQIWDIVLTDHALPRMTSATVLQAVQEREIDLPCVIVSGHIGEEAAVKLMRAGASDYLNKERLNFLPVVVEREVRDARDRAAKRAVEEELENSRREVLQVFESITEGFVTIDFDHHITYVNPRIEKIFGRPVAEISGQRLSDAFPEFPEDQLEPLFDQVRERGAPHSWEVPTTGEHAWLEARIYPTSDGWALYILDITERKLSEQRQQELLQSLEYEHSRLGAILEQLPSGVLAIDLPEGTLSLSNSRALEIRDRPLRDNATLEEVHQWLHGDDAGSLSSYPLVRSAEKGEVVQDEEISFVHPDGMTRFLNFNSSPVYNELGEILAVVATATDITEYRNFIAALEEREELLRLVVETLPVGLWIIDAEGKRVVSNTVADEIFGTPEWIRLEPSSDFGVRSVDSGELIDEWAYVRALRDGESTIGQLLQLDRQDGESRVIFSSTVPVRDAQGAIVAAIVVQQDVTELRETRSMLRRAEERYQNLVEHMPAVTYVAEPWEPHRVSYISPQIKDFLGYSASEVLARVNHWMFMESPDVRTQLFAERHSNRTSDHPPHFEYELVTAEGNTVWVRDDALLMRDEDGVPLYWQGVLMDITERKKLEFDLLHQAFHDSLTGMPNRALFADRTRQALARSERTDTLVGLLFIDLDNFKVVNDSLGHSAGDDLVRQVGTRLLGCLRSGDTAARMGGDEFTVLVEDVPDSSVVLDLAQRIMRVFKQPFEIDGHQVFVTPSIGVRYTSSGDEDAEMMLRDADLAMYQAKQLGRNRVEVFDRSLNEDSFKRFKIEADLHRAIRNEEFVVYYQPIFSFDEVRVVAVEALVRWNHPERGEVSPYEFIAIAEETGLILPIGAIVLEEACRQLARWQAEDSRLGDVRIWVNVSGKQIADPELIPLLKDLIEKYEINSTLLGVEITESTTMENHERVLPLLLELRELGISLAIDDFGTGYSSLGALRQLPVDTLKIDRGFVDGLLSHSDDLVIVAGILSLADALGLDVIAEGIESTEQLERLRELGCGLGQGFCLARPAPIDKLSNVLANGNPSVIPNPAPIRHDFEDNPAARPANVEEARKRYLELIIDGNHASTLEFVNATLARGELDPVEFCLNVIQPSLYEVGNRWERGEITVAHEHLATLISVAVVHHICDGHMPANEKQSSILLAGVQGEQHDLGARMVAGILQSRGYGVLYLGTDVPHESLLEFARELKPDAILLSVTTPANHHSAFEAVQRLRIGYSSQIPVLVGGQGARQSDGFQSMEGVFITPTVFDAFDALDVCLGPRDDYASAS